MIKMQGIRKIYRTEHVETHALDSFDLDVQAGEFISIMGPSGSGKTTLLNLTGLLDGFDHGSYILDGEDVTTLPDRQMSRIRNLKIGFIFQTFNLIPDLNVFDNVDVPLRYRGLPAKRRRAAIEEALSTVGLRSRSKHLPSQLSGGQQQRVAVARAIVGRPRLILADEPTGNLDSAMANDIMDLLEDINENGTTVMMVTHDPDLAHRAARQIHLLDGSLIDLKTQDSHVPLAAMPTGLASADC
ncbi:ABC transporter ATP-binding protein [bacterium]|nr:ABC transporter ATP-binding protein [bacterium]